MLPWGDGHPGGAARGRSGTELGVCPQPCPPQRAGTRPSTGLVPCPTVPACGAAGDSRPGPHGRVWPRGERSVGSLCDVPGREHRAPSTIPLWGQAGGWVPSRRLAADVSQQTGAPAGSARGLPLTLLCTGTGARRPWAGRGSPRLTVQGGHREPGTAKHARGDPAEHEVRSVPVGTPQRRCCHALRLC